MANATPSVVGTTVADSSDGKTVINDAVIAKITGIAVREVPGVFALGGGAARAFGAIRDAIGSSDMSQGVTVEVGETQVAADVTIVAEYPMALQGVADSVRAAAYRAITQLVGMDVAEINVTITDVHVPGEDTNNNNNTNNKDSANTETRVQ